MDPRREFNFVEQALCLKILFPDNAKELNLDQEAFEGLKRSLGCGRYFFGNNFAYLVICAKILFSDRVSELNLDNEAIEMKNKLKEFRQHGLMVDFANQAFCLHILSAKEVKITNLGLELIMPGEDLDKGFKKEEKRKRPERRSF